VSGGKNVTGLKIKILKNNIKSHILGCCIYRFGFKKPHGEENLLSEIKDAEIVVGIAGAVGTNLTLVSIEIVKALRVLDYRSQVITLSETIKSFDSFENLNKLGDDEFERVSQFMEAGDTLRAGVKSGAAMALLGIAAIREYRKQSGGSYDVPLKRQAYILRSLKRPEEIEELRKIYGNSFVLFSVYSPLGERINRLANKICQSNKDSDPGKYIDRAKELIIRDDKSGHKKFGQNILDAFPLGDVFIKE
jgi:cytidine deaminase